MHPQPDMNTTAELFHELKGNKSDNYYEFQANDHTAYNTCRSNDDLNDQSGSLAGTSARAINHECPPSSAKLCPLPAYFFDSSGSEYDDDDEEEFDQNKYAPFTPDTPQNYVEKSHFRGSRFLEFPCNFKASNQQRQSVFDDALSSLNSHTLFPQELITTPEKPLDTRSSSRNDRLSVFDPMHKNAGVESVPSNGIASTPDNLESNVMSSFAGATATATWEQPLYPIEQVMHGLSVIRGEDAAFNISLSNLIQKLSVAHSDLKSAFLFRDFAGSFTEFLDRFGPGAYDSHRAPNGISWIIKLILPWLHMCHPEYQDQCSIYSEVCGWAFNIVHLLGQFHSSEILDEGLWDSSCDQMAHNDPMVSRSAYGIVKKIVVTLDLDWKLVNKALLIRHRTFGFDDVEMFYIRNYRVNLIKHLLYRINYTLPAEQAKDYAIVILNELKESIQVESNNDVLRATEDCISLAHNLSQGVSIPYSGSLSSKYLRPSIVTSSVCSSTGFKAKEISVGNEIGLLPDTECDTNQEYSQGPVKLSKRTRVWNKVSRAMNYLLQRPVTSNETETQRFMNHPDDDRSWRTIGTNRVTEIIRTFKSKLRGNETPTSPSSLFDERSHRDIEAMFVTTHQTLFGE